MAKNRDKLEIKTERDRSTVNSFKAQGVLEFALVLPIVLLLILGIIEFGRLMFIYSATSSSSREAARYGASTENVGGGTRRYVDCPGIRNAAKRVGILAGIQDGNIAIEYDDGATLFGFVCDDGPDPSEIDRGDRIVVSVTAFYQPVVPIVNIPPIPISSTTARTIIKDVAISGSPPNPPGPTATPTPTPLPPGCPVATNFDKQENKKLKLGLSNPTPANPVVIENVVLTWSGGGGNLKSLAFLSLSWNGNDGPPTFDLSTHMATPVWSGTFDQQDMIFTFSGNVSGSYFVTVTFGGDDCDPVSETYID